MSICFDLLSRTVRLIITLYSVIKKKKYHFILNDLLKEVPNIVQCCCFSFVDKMKLFQNEDH